MNSLEKNGFFILKQLIDSRLVEPSLKSIKELISESALDLGVSYSDYMNCTGRWGSNSKITKSLLFIDLLIQPILEETLGYQIIKKKANVICKNADLVEDVAFHQDISYSYNDPYHFSVWLAFNDVSEESGVLKVVKYSHTLPIQRAVDFWAPDFEERNIRFDNIELLPVLAGDAIIFDSRLWHGSEKNIRRSDRFVYVTRWNIIGKDFPYIPTPRTTVGFGMFNCGELTKKILLDALFVLQYNIESTNIERIIEFYISRMDEISTFFLFDKESASNDLKKVYILHRASQLHDAGDVCGNIYKSLWHTMLKFLNAKTHTL